MTTNCLTMVESKNTPYYIFQIEPAMRFKEQGSFFGQDEVPILKRLQRLQPKLPRLQVLLPHPIPVGNGQGLLVESPRAATAEQPFDMSKQSVHGLGVK